METVKKFGWAPDIIHCHGWMTSLVPMYLNKIYRNDPIFEHAKLIYSVYKESYEHTFDDSFFDKASINDLDKEDLKTYHHNEKITLHQGAIVHSDALITVGDHLDEAIMSKVSQMDTPHIHHQKEEFEAQYLNFYKQLLEE